MLQKRFLVDKVLAVSFGVIEEYGYKSTSSDYATVSKVAYVLGPPHSAQCFETWEKENKKYTAKKNFKLAKKAIRWLKKNDEDTHYIKKVKSIYDYGTLTYSELGIVVSSAWAYLRENKKKSSFENKSNSYVGSIGERLDLKLKLVYYRVYDDFAQRLRLQFEDKAGNLFVWFTSSVYLADGLRYKDMQIEKDVFYQVRGTVKEHCEFVNRKQTNLVRCSIKVGV